MYSPKDSPFVTLFMALTKYLFLTLVGVAIAWAISLVFDAKSAASVVFAIALPWVFRLIYIGGFLALGAAICEAMR